MDVDIRRRYSPPSVRRSDEGYKWNSHQEEVVKGWGNTSQYYYVMHNRSAKYYQTLNKWLGIPATALAAIVGTAEFGSLAGDQCDMAWVHVMGGILALIATGLGIAYNFLEYEKRASKHLLASSLYESFYLDVVEELAFKPQDRTNVKAFMRSSKKTLKSLKEASPDIPEHILDKYIKDLDHALVLAPVTAARGSSHVIDIKRDDEKEEKQSGSPTPTPPPPIPMSTQPRNLPSPKSQERAEPESDWDLQDDFAKEMERRVDARKNKIEEFHLNRLKSNLDGVDDSDK
jgi:hypothetical protein